MNFEDDFVEEIEMVMMVAIKIREGDDEIGKDGRRRRWWE